VLNVRDGGFSELALLHYSKTWGSTYDFTTIISDNRLYRPINRRETCWQRSYLVSLVWASLPFNQLSLLGGESLMRGYYQGRFRDRNQLAAQVEYRMLPCHLHLQNVGVPQFSDRQVRCSINLVHCALAILYGQAVRAFAFWFPKKDIYSRLDLAFTKEGKGVYIFIGEAF
jgi:hypothetical protein